MTTIDRKAVIAKARKVSQAVYLATDKGVADDIRDTIESLLALVPEPAEATPITMHSYESPEPAEDDREELARIVKGVALRFGPLLQEFVDDPPTRKHYAEADAILAAGFTRRPLLTEEMVEAAAKELARLDLPDSHTLDDRLLAVERWRRYEYEARRVLSAALTPEVGQ